MENNTILIIIKNIFSFIYNKSSYIIFDYSIIKIYFYRTWFTIIKNFEIMLRNCKW